MNIFLQDFDRGENEACITYVLSGERKETWCTFYSETMVADVEVHSFIPIIFFQ